MASKQSSTATQPQAQSRQNKNDRGMARRDPYALMSSEMAPWARNVDVVQRGNELVVRADLPGVTPDDVTVEASDDAITVSGQRGEEKVEDDGNVYRVERTCGAFFRRIPLPDGAMADQAKASFRDGVLEITCQRPCSTTGSGGTPATRSTAIRRCRVRTRVNVEEALAADGANGATRQTATGSLSGSASSVSQPKSTA